MARWCQDGKLHREDGPAVVRYNNNGEVRMEHWYKNGKRDRANENVTV